MLYPDEGLHQRAGAVQGDHVSHDKWEDVDEAEKIRQQIDKLQMKLQTMQDKMVARAKKEGTFDPITGLPRGSASTIDPSGMIGHSQSRTKELKMRKLHFQMQMCMLITFVVFLLGSAILMQVAHFYKYEWMGQLNDFFGIDFERAKREFWQGMPTTRK